MSLYELKEYVENNMPVICCVQDYGTKRETGAKFNYGHYLTVIGIYNDLVICQDSSEDNVIIPHSDSVQEPGKIVINIGTWQKIWHDEDGDGNKYFRFGIAIGRQ